MFKAIEEHRNSGNNKNHGANKICPFKRIGVLLNVLLKNFAFIVSVLSGNSVCDYRNKNGYDTCAQGADKTGNSKNFTSDFRIIGEAG